MKDNIYRKFRLGAFVLVGILIFLAGVYYLGRGKNLFRPTLEVYAQFRNVSGLHEGNNVRFAGINVGTVAYIEIVSDSTVRVAMRVRKRDSRFIKKDSKASIGNEGVMGNRIVTISAGGPATPGIEDGDELQSVRPVNIDDVLVNLEQTTENAAILTKNLALITEKINSGEGTIGKLLSDSVVAQDLDQTISNLKVGTRDFNSNMEALENAPVIGKLIEKGRKRKQKDKRNE